MRIGIFGEAKDPQCAAVAREAAALGAEALYVDSRALDEGQPLSMLDGKTFYLGQPVDEVRGFYVRSIPAPYVAAMKKDPALVLHEDWFTTFNQTRGRAGYFVAWLLQLSHRGATLVNGPHAASVMQYPPYQLHALRSLGARVPRTLISNDPAAIRAFHAEVKDVLYKPLLGGAGARALEAEALERLEALTAAPVIFQERVQGEDVRVLLVGDELVSCVASTTPEQRLALEGDADAGELLYHEVALPEPVQRFCRAAARACGLTFAGFQLKQRGNDFVFLELNSTPGYLEVELQLGHRISRAIARRVVEGARAAMR
ncbi:MAG: hypothetical protein JXB05_20115 [Myxococcaceae bacterium]|nr:hypothetical protein [Myxococcaceae bacterium]